MDKNKLYKWAPTRQATLKQQQQKLLNIFNLSLMEEKEICETKNIAE